MSNQLFIFYSRQNSPLQAVSAYHHFASDHARQGGISLSITDVDVDPNDPSDLEFWGKNCVIECVAVQDDQRVRGSCNPTLEDLSEIIDSL